MSLRQATANAVLPQGGTTGLKLIISVVAILAANCLGATKELIALMPNVEVLVAVQHALMTVVDITQQALTMFGGGLLPIAIGAKIIKFIKGLFGHLV